MGKTLVGKLYSYSYGELYGEAVEEKVLFIVNILVLNKSGIALCAKLLYGVCSLLDKAVEMVADTVT